MLSDNMQLHRSNRGQSSIPFACLLSRNVRHKWLHSVDSNQSCEGAQLLRNLNMCSSICICSRSIFKSSSLAPLFQIWPISKEAATAAARSQFWQGASGVAAKQQRRQQQRGCCSDSRFLRTVQRFLIKRRAKSSNKGFLSGPERCWHRFSRTPPSTAASSRAVTCNRSQGTSGWCYLRPVLLCSKQTDMGCQFGIRCVVCHERILPIRATLPLNYGLIFSSSGQYLLQNSSI